MDRNIVTIYSLFDRKANTYGGVFCSSCDGTAIRSVVELIQAGPSQIIQYPEDFVLTAIGDLNLDTGDVTNCGNRFVTDIRTVIDDLKRRYQSEKTVSNPQPDATDSHLAFEKTVISPEE